MIVFFAYGLKNVWFKKCLYYLPQPSASADNTDLGFDNS